MQAQTVFKIADYKIFPPEMEILDIKPDIIEWGVGGSYLLLDKINHQLVSVGSLSGMQMVGGFGRKAVSFSEPFWGSPHLCSLKLTQSVSWNTLGSL